jgi:hypothetical protein
MLRSFLRIMLEALPGRASNIWERPSKEVLSR